VQAVLQQTPFTQNPVAHCAFDVHVSANDGSYEAPVLTAFVPLLPPAISTIPLASNVAV
jgi:hypothetical protein